MTRLIHVVGYAIRGGCETDCSVFIQNTPQFSHRVIVLGVPGPMTAEWQAMGASVEHLDLLRRGWWTFFRRIRGLWRNSAKDGVLLWAGIRVPLLLGGRRGPGSSVVIHAGNPFTSGRSVDWKLVLADWLVGRPKSVHVMACSEYVARSFRLSRYFRTFPIGVTLNPIEAPPENPHRPRELRENDEVRLGMVARLDPIKDHGTLLRTFAIVRRSWPKARLELAGDGSSRAGLEILARELGVADAVHFHGMISDVPGFLQTLDLFCYATTEREGMGNALAEALAHGLPCVATDLPAMREVVGEDPPVTLLVPPRDPDGLATAADSLLGNLEKRRTLSDLSFLRARHVFAPAVVVARYLEALGLSA